MRSDTQRNRRQLIKAAGQLFAARRGPISMTDIAKHAEISTATAYRHFASVEDILSEYRFGVGQKLRDFSLKQDATGLELLVAVSRKWVDLVTRHGGAMLYTRSGEGYLARLRKGAFYLTVQAEALERPLRETCDELGLEPLGDEAMFLWNILFDPREILDLINTVGLTKDQATERLVAALKGAMTGWSEDRASGGRTSDERAGADSSRANSSNDASAEGAAEAASDKAAS
ncbi:putative TetR family transcriptional regulator [Arthrobacter globiformis NBRC 12137]|uniref:Putative TetR family transcriptional regulator n=1 Tax=Arthrobacter globiformis (strain ATCC 8010 / DSM 20124 / JCM 1332 / NBRC 12137 / NCIMB 8907 / NRRL B-2979 / 168) TaxID=1077972 RepID=H0QQQ4_ARTG1|nr:TetR/AcrR family transcriptional regulator [Arthrobacter globiformis]GAB15155.1 putative TetR family transcriptional regulator [Arthrobacter globiformis NBRC 12137]